jgi:hypothetical protein
VTIERYNVCSVCGRRTADGRPRCPDHPYRWRGGSTREWRTTRQRILLRDGGRCTHVDSLDQRWTQTTLLEVHHRFGGSTVDVPDDQLETRCRKHNPRQAPPFVA